jgi:hypothetical protein
MFLKLHPNVPVVVCDANLSKAQLLVDWFEGTSPPFLYSAMLAGNMGLD